MAIIVKKGQLEKLNKNISQRKLEKRKTYTVAEILIASLQLKQKKHFLRFLKKIADEKMK